MQMWSVFYVRVHNFNNNLFQTYKIYRHSFIWLPEEFCCIALQMAPFLLVKFSKFKSQLFSLYSTVLHVISVFGKKEPVQFSKTMYRGEFIQFSL